MFLFLRRKGSVPGRDLVIVNDDSLTQRADNDATDSEMLDCFGLGTGALSLRLRGFL